MWNILGNTNTMLVQISKKHLATRISSLGIFLKYVYIRRVVT